MTRFDIFLALLSLALVVWLAAILVRRGLYKQYPYFFAYIAFSIFAHLAGFSAQAVSYRVYFDIYWTTEAFHAVLALLALYEAFHDVFRIDYEDWPWFWIVFPSAVAILVALVIGDALLHPPVKVGAVVTIVLSFGRAVNFVKGGLFVLFLLLVFLLAERWQRYPFGIVTGFAVSTVVSAVAYWAISVFETKGILFVRYGLPVAYILSVTVWIGTCLQKPDREPQWPRMGVVRALTTVSEYSRLLKWITGRR
jgi:hypothetical protein